MRLSQEDLFGEPEVFDARERTNEAARLVAAIPTGEWFTAQEIADRSGLDKSDVPRLIEWVRKEGIHLIEVWPGSGAMKPARYNLVHRGGSA